MNRFIAVLGMAFMLEAGAWAGELDTLGKLQKSPDTVTIKEGTSLKEAIDAIGTLSGVAVKLDGSFTASFARQPVAAVSDTGSKLTWAQVLGKVLSPFGLRYAVIDAKVVVGTPAGLRRALLDESSVADEAAEQAALPFTVGDAAIAQFEPAPNLGIHMGSGLEGQPFFGPMAHGAPWGLGGLPYSAVTRNGITSYELTDGVIIPSPGAFAPRHMFSSTPYFLKPDYLYPYYLGMGAQSTGNDTLQRMKIALKANPKLTASELIKILESDE